MNPRQTGTGQEAQGYDLLRWFSVVSFLAAAVVSAGLALVLTRFVDAQLLRHDAELSRQFVQSIVDAQDVARHFEAGPGSEPPAAFAAWFGRVARMPDVMRANIYAPDGRVLWSSDPALLGRRFEDNDELQRALRGDLVIERGIVGEHAKREHLALAQDLFVENYLPVYRRFGDAAAPIGVVELYRIPRALNETLRSGALLVWSASLVGGLLLYLSTLGLVRKASRLMHEQRARLVDAETLAVIGEISASVAHSIRNPLASIRSTAEVGRELGTIAADVANDTITHVDRIEHLVRTLLAYAADPGARAGERLAGGTADVCATLNEVLDRFRPAFRAQNKAIELRVADRLPQVHGQSILIAQVANTLLSNALEATAAGDTVVLSARRAGGQVMVEVCDSGPGIAADGLAKLFQPFHTTKRHGLGMGLALARRTLARIGGSIELRSRPGQTSAIVSLAASEA